MTDGGDETVLATAWARLGRWRDRLDAVSDRRVIATSLLVGLVSLVAVVGARTLAPELGPPAGAVDRFERDDGAEIGMTDNGAPWVTEGAWAVSGGRAVVSPPFADGEVRTAVVDTGLSTGTVTVAGTPVGSGWGVVFRYRDPDNYWAVQARAGFANYALVQVTDGRVKILMQSGLAPSGPGTQLSVAMADEEVRVRVDGTAVMVVKSDPDPSATSVGLIAFDESALDAWWEGFAARASYDNADAF